MEKPSACAVCDGPLEQPATGRPRVYCSKTCRRAAEYRIRNVNSLLLRAMRMEQDAALNSVAGGGWDTRLAVKRYEWWKAERERLEDELLLLLSEQSGEEEQSVSEAAAVMARNRRSSG